MLWCPVLPEYVLGNGGGELASYWAVDVCVEGVEEEGYCGLSTVFSSSMQVVFQRHLSAWEIWESRRLLAAYALGKYRPIYDTFWYMMNGESPLGSNSIACRQRVVSQIIDGSPYRKVPLPNPGHFQYSEHPNPINHIYTHSAININIKHQRNTPWGTIRDAAPLRA